MKPLFYLSVCLILTSNAHAQIEVASADWQADLRFLQDAVHNDYPFLFKKITAEKFDAEVEKLHKAIPVLQEHEIVTGLARIVSAFGYGHTSLDLRRSPAKFHQLPINLYEFKDGIYVEGVHKDYERALGARLVAVEGVPVDKALSMIRPVVPAENDQFFKAYGPRYLTIPEVLHAQGVVNELKKKITLTLDRDGESFELSVIAGAFRHFPNHFGFTKQFGSWLSARDQDQTPLYLKNPDKIYYYEHLPENKTVYVRHSKIQDDPKEDIPAFYQRLFEFVDNNDVERLVLDLRLNGGGNNYKNKPIVTGIIGAEKINQPGHLFVIIGRRTFSACQNLVNELDNYTNVIFVGEPTSENINFYGDNRQVVLPKSKIPVHLSFAWWQDKPQWENGPWTAPQLAVEMSFDDYRSNRDPVLDAALNFSDDDFILDPMTHLKELFLAGKLAEVRSEAERFVNDPKYRFYDFEAKFNQAGYDLLGSDQLDPALFVFELNTKLFPKSANTWDSLAEANWRAKQTEKAIEYYNKAIELDPDGSVGDNARNMLKQIKAEKNKVGN